LLYRPWSLNHASSSRTIAFRRIPTRSRPCPEPVGRRKRGIRSVGWGRRGNDGRGNPIRAPPVAGADGTAGAIVENRSTVVNATAVIDAMIMQASIVEREKRCGDMPHGATGAYR
jgi:hypothetical protein